MNRLAHLTLSTGHVADTPFGDRDLADLDPIRDLLTAALRGERADLPDPGTGYRLNARSTPPRLAALVTGPHGPAFAVNVCSDDRDGRAWLDLREHYLADHFDAAADLPDRLRAPWCAVDLLPALFLDLQAVQWAGDFERLLAWTWCAWWT